jgi:hypothetical protein
MNDALKRKLREIRERFLVSWPDKSREAYDLCAAHFTLNCTTGQIVIDTPEHAAEVFGKKSWTVKAAAESRIVVEWTSSGVWYTSGKQIHFHHEWLRMLHAPVSGE